MDKAYGRGPVLGQSNALTVTATNATRAVYPCQAHERLMSG